MGLATAWQLARRGREVLVVEQYGIGTMHGASHGACRNFNPHYATQPHLDLVREAEELFTELEGATGRRLLERNGLVSHGGGTVFQTVHDRAREAGVDVEFVPVADAERRWPGIRFDQTVIHTPGAGRIRADETLLALDEDARAHGAELRFGVRASGIVDRGDRVEAELETIATGERERISADVLVTAAGAWTTKLLDGRVRLPYLRVTEESPVHFPRYDESLDWPSFNHRPEPGDARYRDYWRATVYGMLTPGEGVKAGWHRVGPERDPDARTFTPHSPSIETIQEYAREWLPGVDADVVEPISCTYTTAPDSLFVCDRVDRVVVLAGFAGEGYKFVPAIGRLGADLVDGAAALPAFALDRDLGERDCSGLATVL